MTRSNTMEVQMTLSLFARRSPSNDGSDLLKNHVPTPGRPVTERPTPRIACERNKLQDWIDNPPEHLTRLVTITPEMAGIMMERNESDEWKNRTLSRVGMERYVRAMKSGGWIVTGDTIKFTKNGRLIDGQHRLEACMKSGVAFKSLVAFGIPEEAFKVTDRSITRTASHVFDIEQVPNYVQVSAISRAVYSYKNRPSWEGSLVAVDNDVLLDFYHEHADALQASLPAARRLHKEGLMPIRWAAFCYLICAEKNKKEADAFFAKVTSGLNIQRDDDPAQVLRKALEKNARSVAKYPDQTLAALFIKAWNCHRTGKRLGSSGLRWSNEPFPRAM